MEPIEFDKLADEALAKTARSFASLQPPICQLTCSPWEMSRLTEFLCRLRSEGVAALVHIKAPSERVQDEVLEDVFSTLRNFEQLLLKNILELCLDWIPAEYHTVLKQESKTELKWFEQWQAAAHDVRIHKYPILPWRSFLRKINTENYIFARELMSLSELPNTPQNKEAMRLLLQRFLEEKKKTICIFPKRWN